MKKILWIMIFLIMMTGVLATQPTMQYNKLLLTPFYVNSMTQNVQYNYSVDVITPDGISQVRTAILTLDAWINPTRTFNAWMNNVQCNTANYTISTTYAGAGRGVVTFDCTNAILPNQLNTVRYVVTGGNIGSSTAWLDLTYMNDPSGELDVFGTEYQGGDDGKVFVQLLDSQGVAINNGTCYGTIFYPNGTKWFDETIMAYQSGSNGFYYLDLTAPFIEGVYMVDVYCEYYTYTQNDNASNYVVFEGWYIGGNGTSLTLIDNDYLSIAERNYNRGYNSSNISTLLMGHLDEYVGNATEDTSGGGSGTHNGGVIIGVVGVAGAGVDYDGVNDYTMYPDNVRMSLNATQEYMVCLSFNESVSNPNGEVVLDSLGGGGEGFKFSFEGGNKVRFLSDRSGSGAKSIDSPLAYLDSLWHTVCGYASFTTLTLYIDGVSVITSAEVQSGVMNPLAVTVGAVSGGGSKWADVSIDEVCYMAGVNFSGGESPAIMASNYHTNKQCGVSQADLDINVTISGVSVLPEYINYNIITTYLWDETPENVVLYLYNYTGGSWYQLPNSLPYASTPSTVSSQLSIDISQFLSGGIMTVRMVDSMPNGSSIGRLRLDQVRLSQINYVETPITQVRGGGELHITNHFSEVPINVWSYPVRNLTHYENFTQPQTDLTNYSRIDEPIYAINESINARIGLLETALSNIMYAINISIVSEVFAVPLNVWAYSTRNLTYYPPQQDLTNYSLVSDGVWAYDNRTLTAISQSFIGGTEYSTSETAGKVVARMTDNAGEPVTGGNCTLTVFFNNSIVLNQTPMIEYIGTPQGVYYKDFNLSGVAGVYPYAVDCLKAGKNYYMVSSYHIFGNTPEYIANAVWNVSVRNLTFYPVQTDLTNYSLINDGVWSYPVRNLTFYPVQVDLTNYTLITNSVWSYNGNISSVIGDYVGISTWNATARYTHGVVLS